MRSLIRHPDSCPPPAPRYRPGFTLIELMIVVAIIAIMIAILIPSLARAREQAKIIKCMANMKAMSMGMLTFSEDHNGYGQLMAIGDEWRQIDSSRKRYEYDADNAGNPILSPWPVAYGPYIGARGMTTENYFDTSRPGTGGGGGTRRRGGGGDAAPAETTVKSEAPVLRCPSDLNPIHNVGFPRPLFGILSYSINHDLFGTSIGGGRTWRDGKAQTGRRLEGNLINIVRPSEVVVFIDGGNDPYSYDGALIIDSDHGNGPYLPGYSIKAHGLPVNRHSKKGGLSAALADGHASYLKAVSWFDHNVQGGHISSQKFVERFSPHPRVTPYAAHARGAPGPGGGGTTRRR